MKVQPLTEIITVIPSREFIDDKKVDPKSIPSSTTLIFKDYAWQFRRRDNDIPRSQWRREDKDPGYVWVWEGRRIRREYTCEGYSSR